MGCTAIYHTIVTWQGEHWGHLKVANSVKSKITLEPAIEVLP